MCGNAAESKLCDITNMSKTINRSNILDLVMTNERGMVDSILHESPLGK